MKKITQKLLLFITLMGISIATAQVVPNGLWYKVGNTSLSTVTDDGDNGDGTADGAIEVVGLNNTPDLGVKFTFNGTMQNATTYAISSVVYNTVNSYVNFKVSLYNVTDGLELASTATISVGAGSLGTPTVQTVTLSYNGVATDAGDVLEVRYIRVENNISRKFKIDNLSLNGTFATEALQAVSPAGNFGVIDAANAEPSILTTLMDDADNGDGAMDGAILVDGKNTSTPQGAKFTLTETMVAGKRYKAESTIYKASASFSRVSLQLWNATDGVLLASSTQQVLDNSNPIMTTSVTYDAQAGDAGDILEIRWERDPTLLDLVRDFAIDTAKINDVVIPVTSTTLSVGTTNLSDGFSVYPNPTNNVININNSNANNTIKNVSLINVIGKTVYSNTSLQPIDVSNFSKGLYILRIEAQDGGVATKKVILK